MDDEQRLVNVQIKHRPTQKGIRLQQILVLVMWKQSPKKGGHLPTPDEHGETLANMVKIEISQDRSWPHQ